MVSEIGFVSEQDSRFVSRYRIKRGVEVGVRRPERRRRRSQSGAQSRSMGIDWLASTGIPWESKRLGDPVRIGEEVVIPDHRPQTVGRLHLTGAIARRARRRPGRLVSY